MRDYTRREANVSDRHPCPRCGYENDVGQRFCGSCGAALVVTCRSCGAENPLGHSFCGQCGTELTPTRATAAFEERRVVTVVFADLVGFTSRAEQLDPEDVRAMLSSYYARLRADLEAFGGTVEKFIGDAVMAVFGAPVAHGDDPERAVRAALAIRDSVDAMNEADPARDLQIRIAVNTGEAIVTVDAAAPRGEGMVAGDVVNTASRLQTAAPTNGVLVGDETYRATRASIVYEELEPLVVKGKQAPVRAWLATSVRERLRDQPKEAPLVGRDSELSVLRGIWDRAVRENRPHLVTLLAPAGMGKSRLSREFGARVEDDGGRVIVGRCLPYGASSPYLPFRHQIKDVAGVFENDPTDVASAKLADFVRALLDGDDAAEVAAHVGLMIGLDVDRDVEDRQVLFFSARRLVEALARGQPTVLAFEDIHWGDPSLLDLVEHLASRVRDVPLVLLTLARPELLDGRPTWGSRVPAFTSLPLEPLEEPAARELATRLLLGQAGENAYDDASRLADTAGGNPLFIEELAASVAEGATAGKQVLPTTIRAIISARLDALPPVERSLVVDASVIGKAFWSGGLQHFGWESATLAEALDSLEARDLIRRDAKSRVEGEQQFSFKHALIRDVAYGTLPRARRRERHAAFARYVEGSARDHTGVAAFLAHHWREAGDRERALEYLLTAADQASRGWAKAEAVKLYGRALELVPADDLARQRRIKLRQAVAGQAALHIEDVELRRQADQRAAPA